MKLIFVSFLICLISIGFVQSESKVLRKYVEKYDPNYHWTLNATYEVGNNYVYVLELTSQAWKPESSSQPVWKHWLQICKSKNFVQSQHKTALLLIDNGYNTNWTVPTVSQLNTFGMMACSNAKPDEITATVLQVPNQFIEFEHDGQLRKEDDIVAYSWIKAMNTKDKNWISLLPQTKSAVKAMDAVEEFGKTITGNYTVNKFVVTGASKRGWTAWGTAIVDKRVVGIAPMVIPVLNIVETIESQVQAYGNFSFALADYIKHNVTQFFYTKYFKMITKVVDPINYLNTLKNIPKYIIIGTSDEFFLPDSTKTFFNKLKGESLLSIMPNTNHGGILKQEVVNQVSNFYRSIYNGIEIPEINWSIKYSNDKNTGTITMNVVKGIPTRVLLWSATTLSSTKRDFRMFTCPAAECYQNIVWTSKVVNLTSLNSYNYTMSKPSSGWTGFYFQVDFNTTSTIKGNTISIPSSFTSEMSVVPDIYPFEKCAIEVCGSGVPTYIKNKQSNSNVSDVDENEDIEEDDDN